jgi:hypothetical protein
MSEQQIPSVGRIVHYVSQGTPVREDGTQAYTSQCRAAIVTGEADCDAHMECVSLAVLNPEGMFFNQHVAHNETSQQRGGTWHWPERV